MDTCTACWRGRGCEGFEPGVQGGCPPSTRSTLMEEWREETRESTLAWSLPQPRVTSPGGLGSHLAQDPLPQGLRGGFGGSEISPRARTWSSRKLWSSRGGAGPPGGTARPRLRPSPSPRGCAGTSHSSTHLPGTVPWLLQALPLSVLHPPISVLESRRLWARSRWVLHRRWDARLTLLLTPSGRPTWGGGCLFPTHTVYVSVKYNKSKRKMIRPQYGTRFNGQKYSVQLLSSSNALSRGVSPHSRLGDCLRMRR